MFQLMAPTWRPHGPQPQEVVLVMPPESVHRRNLAARRAADARPEDSGSRLELSPRMGEI